MSIALTNGHGPQIGDPCPREACIGVLRVYSTKVLARENVRIRYLHCRLCHCLPDNNQQIVPLQYAPPRRLVTPLPKL